MTKEIELTQGYKTTVDDEDFEYLNQFKWHIHHGYAAHNVGPRGKQTFIKMHRVVLGLKLDRELNASEEPDHIDGNPLNNTRCNLRISTHKQNMRNKLKTQSPTSSRFKGVAWSRMAQKWQSQIRIDGELIHIGLFIDEETAARAYDQTALLWFREFSKLNFPDELKIS